MLRLHHSQKQRLASVASGAGCFGSPLTVQALPPAREHAAARQVVLAPVRCASAMRAGLALIVPKKSLFYLRSVYAKTLTQQKEGLPLVVIEFEREGAMRQFSVGEVVTFIPDWILRSAAPGEYKIVSSMPDRDGDHMYRIKSPLEEHERVVRENLLAKSDGCLPDEVVRQRSLRRSITLPSLKQLEVHVHLEPITSMSS